MTTTQFEEKITVTRLLEHEGVQNIICIDDFYDETPSDQAVVEAVMAYDQSAIAGLLISFDCLVTQDNREIMRDEVKEWVGTLLPDVRLSLYRKLLEDQFPDDVTTAASELDNFMQGLEFRKMAPGQWMECRDSILSEADGPRTLLVFDEQLGDGMSGLDLIAHVVAKSQPGKFMCCLLSHTISPDKEREAWEKLSESHRIPKSDFFPISKQRLSDKDYIGFSYGIKHSVLNSQISSLRNEVKSIIENADEYALQRIIEMDLLDIERVVFLSSEQEGIWELDTFFRLFGLFHREESRKKARASTEIQAVVDHVRTVNTIIPPAKYEPNARLTAIQRQELYEDAEFINSSHLQLELGDIFTVGTGGKRLILLAQPCDLMLRSDGTRNKCVFEVVLAEIDKISSTQCVRNETERLMHFELPYYGLNTERWAVCLRRTHVVSLAVLDTCIFQSDGTSKICVKDDVCPPPGIIPSWRKRHASLKTEWLSIYENAEILANNGISQDIISATVLKFSIDGLFKGEINRTEKSIVINCRRTGRLSRSRAEELLSRYASFFARAGFSHELDREIRLTGQTRC